MTKEELSEIIDGIKRQVEWNGWEEPYVTEAATRALKRVFAARARKARKAKQ